MKVGVFLEEIPPEEGGGYTMQGDLLQWLARLADQSQHEFSVFARDPESLKRILGKSPIGTIRFPGSFAERVFSKARRDVTAYTKHKTSTRFEEVARTADLEFIWFLGAEALQIDMPYMAVVWDLQHRLQPWFPEVSANGQWEHRERFYSEFLRRAAFVIAGTEAGREEIQRFYQVPARTIRILKHPTPAFALNAAVSQTTPSNPTKLTKFGMTDSYLLYPAQLWPHKNHANLFYALRVLKEKYNLQLPLALVGSDKGNTEYLKRLARELNVDSQVKFLGFVSQDELIELYRNALTLTYVSYFGPENLPPLEAFALGCPVIAANVNGAAEQLGNAALLIDPNSPEQIAEAIQTLHTDEPLRQELLTRGQMRAQSWTGENFVRGVFSILDGFETIRRCWSR